MLSRLEFGVDPQSSLMLVLELALRLVLKSFPRPTLQVDPTMGTSPSQTRQIALMSTPRTVLYSTLRLPREMVLVASPKTALASTPRTVLELRAKQALVTMLMATLKR
jgi:hypothetical protein